VKPASPAAMVSIEGDIPAVASIHDAMRLGYASGFVIFNPSSTTSPN
jgi:hypothetical protein